MKLAGPAVCSSASRDSETPWAFNLRCRLRTSVKVLSFLAFWSHPGLNVRMFFSNIPWNKPMTWSPFLRISQFCEASPPETVKPNFS